MINISTNKNIEQIMVDFNINWICKAFHMADSLDSVLKKLELILNRSFDQQIDTKNWQGTINSRRVKHVIQFKN